MEQELEWVQIAEFGAQYEADLVTPRLRDADIPYLVKGPESGIFGPGMAGPTPLGVRLFVPSSAADEARGLL